MTALKQHRRDLSAHLAAGLSTPKKIADVALGAKVNPPAVIVQPSTATYLTVEPGYCVDGIDYEVTIVAPPGDLEAQFDALDDLVDKVRATLLAKSPLGFKYSLRSISGPINFAAGESSVPAVVALVHLERETH